MPENINYDVNTESVTTPGGTSTPVETPGEPAPPTEDTPGGEPTEPTSQAGGGEPEGTEPTEGSEPQKESRASKRIRQLIKERDEAREQVEELEGGEGGETKSPPTPQTAAKPEGGLDTQMTPEVERAVNQLKDLGFVTKEELQREQDRQALSTEYDRLEQEIDGSDGRPVFDRKVIEDHAIRTGIFNPKAAYNDLFEDELREWYVKQALSSKPEAPYSEKPKPSAGHKPPLTREQIERMSPAEYERRRPEIMEAMKSKAL